MSRSPRRSPAGAAYAVATALAVVALVVLAPAPARAQSDACVDVCGAACLKPWSMPDRWDDVTGIPGYMGELVGTRRNPDWRNNARLDRETFTDTNGNRLHDAGESFIDGNTNATYDEEAYDPALTGYTAHAVAGNLLAPTGDLGLELVLHPADPFTPPTPGLYFAIDLPPINKGTPITGGDAYRENMATCNPVLVEPGDGLQLEPGGMSGPTNQGMHDLIAQDPDATWDDATRSVIHSTFALSPRIVLVPLHDPRLPLASGSSSLRVTKVVAFFMDRMVGPAAVRGHLLRTIVPGEAAGPACLPGQVGGFIVDCPVPATPASWGRLKAVYR